MPPLFALLRSAQRAVAPVYRRFNAAPEASVVLTAELERELGGYYAEDVRALEELLGRRVPWPRFASSTREWPHAV